MPPVGMARQVAGSTPGTAVLKGLEKTTAKAKGPLLGQGHRGKPSPPESLMGPRRAFKHPTCTDLFYEEQIVEASANASDGTGDRVN